MTQMLEVFIQNIVGRLKEAGIDDPTHEDITCKYQGEVIKFRLYKQHQWDNYVSQQNSALRLYASKGYVMQPDSVITHKDDVFLVRLIK